MSDDDFLNRWSRRKQAAAADAKRVKEEAAAPAPPPETPAKDEPAFDPATLPPIDSITSVSDVRDFLRAGVPAELTRAALRRAWSADPAIRDFIGLSENSWDFTAPDAIPGFGPLNASPEEIRQLVDRIVSRTSDLADASAQEGAVSPNDPPESGAQPQVHADSRPAQEVLEPPAQATAERAKPGTEQQRVDVAMQQESGGDDDGEHPRPRRSRGGALPR